MRQIVTSLYVILTMVSCSDGGIFDSSSNSANGGNGNSPSNGSGDSEWLIPKSEIFDGGPGKDGIPALENPEMVPVGDSKLNYLDDDDLVIGVKDGEDVRAYAHSILDWHEIINDKVGDKYIAVTYCPLTGTAIGWDRKIDGEVTTFGVSGLLYNSNLIPYDRATDSNWSQILNKSVNGLLSGTDIKTYDVVETTYETWKKWYPNSTVTSTNTGHTRSYGLYPYGNYKTSQNLLFPISNTDNRLHPKERVLGVKLRNSTIAYPLNLFTGGKVIDDIVDFARIVAIGSKEENWVIAFDDPRINDEPLELALNDGVITDQLGNTWDKFGEATEGPNKGEKLKKPLSFIGFWFSWSTFYENIVIYEGE